MRALFSLLEFASNVKIRYSHTARLHCIVRPVSIGAKCTMHYNVSIEKKKTQYIANIDTLIYNFKPTLLRMCTSLV